MAFPEAAQESIRSRRQGYEAILVALGVADVYSLPRRIDVANLKAQPFAQAKAETVEGEKEDAVTEYLRGQKNPLSLVNGNDVRYAL